jgi:hypothetical protein
VLRLLPTRNRVCRDQRVDPRVDLTLNWKLHNYATLYVTGRNIRNAPDRWYQSPPGVEQGKNAHLRAMESYGANWVFGVRGQF